MDSRCLYFCLLGTYAPYSDNSTLILLWDPPHPPALVHVIGVEADPTSWLKKYSPFPWSQRWVRIEH